MKKEEKKALKILKKGFTLNEWKDFQDEIKQNDLVLSELSKKLEKLDIESIKQFVFDNPCVIKYLSKRVQLNLVNNENFKFLREDLQLRILEHHNNKAKYASDDVQIKFATSNPLKLSFLSPDNQNKMVKINPYYLGYALVDVQIECAIKDINMLHYCSNMVQCMFVKTNPNYYLKCSEEVKRRAVYLHNLSCDKISEETLETYLSCHYDDLSLEELNKYKEKIQSSMREDREQMVNYIDYLLVNILKKKM